MADSSLTAENVADPREQAQRLVLVTGPSGAGRSTAINVLEDLGFEAIDNLPLSLIPRLLDGPVRPDPLALGLDVRNRDFSASNVIELIDRLTRHPDYAPEVLFLDCDPDVLVRRYNETRRRHPLARDSSPMSGVSAESDLLSPIRARADVLLDTSELTPHDLKAELNRWFDIRPDARLTVSLHSFSYKRGVPRGVDLMFDCRCLANPHWNTALRQLTGRNAEVQSYVASDPRFAEFFDRIRDLLLFLLPAHLDEGKSHLSVGFGCTGGQHRSVTLAEKMAVALADAGWPVSIRHRELERRMPAPVSVGDIMSEGAATHAGGQTGAGRREAPALGETR
ncbi:RNase adapter RapZ [Paracoccus sp. Z330]|uniref:RNase adapter RapZ n=1 Tax=Paracoccus onchidii TaxID=3017813 RepID=A0ABT4ZC00_9RHOB|nr:RNase adapter RapZ [Paracoccus onchidii]MDB6176879.1 RNase adapter RapZ [Paracoccus onchidii]